MNMPKTEKAETKNDFNNFRTKMWKSTNNEEETNNTLTIQVFWMKEQKIRKL